MTKPTFQQDQYQIIHDLQRRVTALERVVVQGGVTVPPDDGGGGTTGHPWRQSLLFYDEGAATTGVTGSWRILSAGTLTRLNLSVTSGPVGSNLVVEIRKNGQVFQTLTMNAGSSTPVSTDISETVGAGDFISANYTSVGSTPAQNVVLQADYTSVETGAWKQSIVFTDPGAAAIGSSGTWRAPTTGTISRITLSATGAPQGSDLSIDIRINSTIIKTLNIAAGTPGPTTVTLTESVAVGDLISVNSTSVGSGTPAQNAVAQVDFISNEIDTWRQSVMFSKPGSATISSSGSWRILATGKITRVDLSSRTAPVGSALTVDFKKNNVTFQTLSIPNNSSTPTSADISTDVIAGDLISVSYTSVGSTTAAQGAVAQGNFQAT